jgi:hypothetical protein
MCQTMATPRQASGCGCGCPGSFRRFVSKAEEQERLEAYADNLQKELKGVRERIDELEGK